MLQTLEPTASTFSENMKLPVHRWFRYSAGFSAQWAENAIASAKQQGTVTVIDPFAGSGTTLLASEKIGVECYGIEAHPFIIRIAKAKLLYKSDPGAYITHIKKIEKAAKNQQANLEFYPSLIRQCFTNEALEYLDKLRKTWQDFADESAESQLVWLTIIAILRQVSHVGTAPWQYILPRHSKKSSLDPMLAFQLMADGIVTDMKLMGTVAKSQAKLLHSDARTCAFIPDKFANLVIGSPPYANNYDYADATRLEMSFMGEINTWGDLQKAVRQYLIRSCSQHVTSKTVNLEAVINATELQSIHSEINKICYQLSETRLLHGGKKNYHLMIACYFLDMARVWQALRRVCKSPCQVCFMIGDSAPYGVYVPVIDWLGKLALSAGFESFQFQKTRDRNVKWKNRKHSVPLCEGLLWVRG